MMGAGPGAADNYQEDHKMADMQKVPEIPDDRADDLHHIEHSEAPDLALFMAGNQFMVMPALIEAFQQQYPDIVKIYYQTLPPGLALKQILAGGARFRGQQLAVSPDVYASVNKPAMEKLVAAGHLDPEAFTCYLHNRLALMVPAGNHAGVETVADLGRADIRISQPDPANEDIGFHIMDMYRAAGGEVLVRKIMEQKRAAGTTVFTRVHHRETPLRIELGTVDVGPVWATEIQHARAAGKKIDVIEPGPELDQREGVNYYIAGLKNAPHPANADRFIRFINSPAAGRIYSEYGFVPPRGKGD
jgi:ABC-type molybdate transport system substrate-binding protein